MNPNPLPSVNKLPTTEFVASPSFAKLKPLRPALGKVARVSKINFILQRSGWLIARFFGAVANLGFWRTLQLDSIDLLNDKEKSAVFPILGSTLYFRGKSDYLVRLTRTTFGFWRKTRSPLLRFARFTQPHGASPRVSASGKILGPIRGRLYSPILWARFAGSQSTS